MRRQICYRSDTRNFADKLFAGISRQSNICFITNFHAGNLAFRNMNRCFEHADIRDSKQRCTSLGIIALLIKALRHNAVSRCRNDSACSLGLHSLQAAARCLELGGRIIAGKAVIVHNLLRNCPRRIQLLIAGQISLGLTQARLRIEIAALSTKQIGIRIHLLQNCQHLTFFHMVTLMHINLFQTAINLRRHLRLPLRIQTAGKMQLRNNRPAYRMRRHHGNAARLRHLRRTRFISLNVAVNAVTDNNAHRQQQAKNYFHLTVL